MNRAADVLAAARQLRAGLSALARALEASQLAAILDAEPVLATALTSAASLRSRAASADFDANTAAAIRSELRRASALLARCAALGGTLDEHVRGRFGVAGYGASGKAIAPTVHGMFEGQV